MWSTRLSSDDRRSAPQSVLADPYGTRIRRLALVTDAWKPQTNGVVNTLVRLVKHLELEGMEVTVVAPDGHFTLPLPSYPEIRIACDPWKAIGRIRGFSPDAVHVATEGPLGFSTVAWLRFKGLYENLDDTWNERAQRLNGRLGDEGLPVRVENLQTIWTVLYTQPGPYNWMLHFYLRAQGLALSWVGTGRFIFSLNYSDADFDAVADKFMAAARAMQADGFWWRDPALTDKAIRRRVLREMISQCL